MDEKLLHADNRDGINLSDFCLLDDGCSSDGSAAGDCFDEDAVYLGARKVRVGKKLKLKLRLRSMKRHFPGCMISEG